MIHTICNDQKLSHDLDDKYKNIISSINDKFAKHGIPLELDVAIHYVVDSSGTKILSYQPMIIFTQQREVAWNYKSVFSDYELEVVLTTIASTINALEFISFVEQVSGKPDINVEKEFIPKRISEIRPLYKEVYSTDTDNVGGDNSDTPRKQQ